jgi:hypothetical protein
MKEPLIILTNEWEAKPARTRPVFVGRPARIIFHHTAGHHPEISNPRNESREEAMRYARAIQNFHMNVIGWNDSGHNLMVCRNGLILVGRHMSYPAIKRGRMVVSAHCPGQNDQPGIEHEHQGVEPMTKAQFHSSAWLMAWIITVCKMRGPTAIHSHNEFFPTSCPGVLGRELPALKAAVARMIRQGTPGN